MKDIGSCKGISYLRVLVMMATHVWTNRASQFSQVHIVWRKMVRISLYAEKIEDGVSDVFIPLVIGYPYFLEGILIGRYWVNHYMYDEIKAWPNYMIL